MKNRGTVLVEVLVVVAAAAVAAKVAGWQPFKAFEKGPPVAALEQARAEADKAKAELKEAQIKLDAAQKADEARKDAQVEHAQEMVAGAQEALKRQPAEHQTEQTALAVQFLDRTELALALAIGRLPEAQQAEIISLVDKALSKYATDRAEAMRLLREKDAELQQVSRERDQIKAEIPRYESKVQALEQKAKDKDEKLAKAETKLGVWASIKDRADRHNASLSGLIERITRGAMILGAAYVFIVFILPGIVKHMQAGRLKNTLRDLSGFTSSPLLYLDAKRKLAAQKNQPNQ
jgi:vacuolar-type H+-ATPase subunit I/STV1